MRGACAPAAEAKDIDLELLAAMRAGASVLGDPDRLQQVLWNLLSNAVKFTPRGGRVAVCAAGARRRSVAAHRSRDTGQGISRGVPAPRLRALPPGRRQLHTRTQAGLGLGLAIVRQLVELHGGTVHAESAGQGQGATFIVIASRPGAARGAAGGGRSAAAPRPPGRRRPPTSTACGCWSSTTRPTAARCWPRDARAARRDGRRRGRRRRRRCRALERDVPDVLVSDIGMPRTKTATT